MDSVTFLIADVPLTKRFNLTPDGLETEPYPHVLNFSSVWHKPKNLKEFYEYLKAHAEHQHCLLKGRCHKTLRSESRASSTKPNDSTDWICLDIDYMPDITNAEDFIKKRMPKELQSTTYIVQLSASAGIKEDKGFSAHLFFELSRPVPAPELKKWLKTLNLHPSVVPYVRLNKIGTALRWPIDISTCQNDKLIYIAPPEVSANLKKKLPKERITYVRKQRSTIDVDKLDFAPDEAQELKLLNALRREAGLKHKTKYIVNDQSVLSSPGTAKITGIRKERGFVYLNLNGGDSWGYYHPINDFEILYNFKGEPNYSIKELLPEYFAQCAQEKKDTQIDGVSHSWADAKTYFVVSSLKSGQYFVGTHSETEGLWIVPTKSRTHCLDFMKQHGQPVPDFIPAWKVEYDFTRAEQFVPAESFINLYKPSVYMQNATISDKATCPDPIHRIIMHALGDDETCYHHFMNWLAFIIQYRRMTGTAWVMSGRQGTGKGVLTSKIIAPILGTHHVQEISLHELEKGFNSFMEHSLLILIDEAQMASLDKPARAIERAKRYITNEQIDMTRKGQDMVMIKSFVNFIIASNTYDPILIAADDRRFNVAPRQEKKLLDVPGITRDLINSGLTEHLQAFCDYLMSYKVDVHAASTPLNTDEKERIQQQTVTAIELVAQHIIRGDLDFFVNKAPLIDDLNNFAVIVGLHQTPSIEETITRLIKTKPTRLTRLDAQVLFNMTVNAAHPRPMQFEKMAGHHGITFNAENEFVMRNEWRISAKAKATWDKRMADKGKPKVRVVK